MLQYKIWIKLFVPHLRGKEVSMLYVCCVTTQVNSVALVGFYSQSILKVYQTKFISTGTSFARSSFLIRTSPRMLPL